MCSFVNFNYCLAVVCLKRFAHLQFADERTPAVNINNRNHVILFSCKWAGAFSCLLTTVLLLSLCINLLISLYQFIVIHSRYFMHPHGVDLYFVFSVICKLCNKSCFIANSGSGLKRTKILFIDFTLSCQWTMPPWSGRSTRFAACWLVTVC